MARMNRQSTTAAAEADLAELREQVSDIGTQLGALISRAKKDGTALAEEELSELQNRIQSLTGDWKDRGREALVRVEETVKEHPGSSLLAAFAAGAALTLLLRK